MNSNSFTSEAASYEVKIYIAGDITMIKHFCQHHCAEGACVTVTPTEYLYTGGREAGAIIGLINYPRFPKTSADIDSEAEKLAKDLMHALVQRSCTIVTPESSFFLQNPQLINVGR